jgi:hypothetical protein
MHFLQNPPLSSNTKQHLLSRLIDLKVYSMSRLVDLKVHSMSRLVDLNAYSMPRLADFKVYSMIFSLFKYSIYVDGIIFLLRAAG